jgi:Uma2 family endonuclease
VKQSRLQDPDQYFQGAPDLAVEIVSPGDDASDLRQKIQQYLDNGTAIVWVIYPRSLRVEVHTPESTIRTLGVEDAFEAPELLPGFRLSVRTILE